MKTCTLALAWRHGAEDNTGTRPSILSTYIPVCNVVFMIRATSQHINTFHMQVNLIIKEQTWFVSQKQAQGENPTLEIGLGCAPRGKLPVGAWGTGKTNKKPTKPGVLGN
jgi:hypothetical protein